MSTDRKVRTWRGMVVLAGVATYALIVFGGVVRITGSGMGCGDDWPLCNGRLIPSFDFATAIEYGHRLAALAVSVLVLAVAAHAWVRGDASAPWRRLRRIGTAAAVLLAVQILLGAITVWLELHASSVVLHMGTAMLLLAILTLGALEAGSVEGGRIARSGRATAVGWGGAAFGFAVVLVGALVASLHAGPACRGFPLCNGSLIPGDNPLAHAHWGHRLIAYVLVGWCVALPAFVRRQRPADRATRRAALVAAVLAVGQLAVGAGMVLSGLPNLLRTLHVALAAAVFAALVTLAWLLQHPVVVATTTETEGAGGEVPVTA